MTNEPGSSEISAGQAQENTRRENGNILLSLWHALKRQPTSQPSREFTSDAASQISGQTTLGPDTRVRKRG